jgi:hypothetical protein
MVDEGRAQEGHGDALTARAAELVRDMSPETGMVDLASWDAIRRRMPAPARRRWRGGRKLVLWAAPALAACFVLGFVGASYLVRPVGVTLEGGRLAEDGEVLSWGQGPSRLRFSDGTVATLSQGSHLRIAGRTRRGARFVLGDGALSLAVVHTGRADWRVDAGPYEVVVTGTKFDVRWARTEETFALSLREGSVLVRGGLAGDGVRLRSGQRLETSAAAGSLEIVDEAGRGLPAASPPSVSAAPGAVNLPSDPGSGTPSTPHPASADEGEARNHVSAAVRREGPAPGRRPLAQKVAMREPRKGEPRAAVLPALSPSTPLPARETAAPVGTSSAGGPANAPASQGLASARVGARPAPGATAPSPAAAPTPPSYPPRVDHTPPPKMHAGGAVCDGRAQFQFEDSTEQFATPGCCSLAFTALSVDKEHSYCGRASLRADASFDLQGRPTFTGYPPHQTGEVKVRINPPQDFTERTVTVRVFVDAPLGVRFSATLYAVSGSTYVPGGYTESCSPGQWCTLRHTFRAHNPVPSGELVPVDRVNQFAFQIKSIGNVTAWSGRVYIDDIRWN